MLLMGLCFVLGIVSIPAGIGGGVLFVPIVSGFFPFHLDFVRGAGLLVALASALAAGPSLLRSGLANLRLSLPLALIASVCSIFGAWAGFVLPDTTVQTALGLTILFIAIIMICVKTTDKPIMESGGNTDHSLSINGVFNDLASGEQIAWRTTRTTTGFILFAGIGFLAGLFGMGAGWANVPALNLVMGIPLKVSAGTSSFILSLVDSTAAWVYLNRGAVLAIIAVPSMLGMMLGARIGAKMLGKMKTSNVRALVITLLFFSGIRSLLKGLGI